MTIAIRYGTIRRQGEVGPDGMEKQVINYPSVHGRLLPILARAYVFIQLGRNLVRFGLHFNYKYKLFTDIRIQKSDRLIWKWRCVSTT